jgi:alpha-L-rhamnosidase
MPRLSELIFFLVALVIPAFAQAPIELRCEKAVNPKSVKSPQPQLSWATVPNYVQRGYQVLVASSEEKLKADEGDLWDSGRVMSDKKSAQYRGKDLSSLQRCYWKVRVWGNYFTAGGFSEPAVWQMGVLVFDGKEPR